MGARLDPSHCFNFQFNSLQLGSLYILGPADLEGRIICIWLEFTRQTFSLVCCDHTAFSEPCMNFLMLPDIFLSGGFWTEIAIHNLAPTLRNQSFQHFQS